MDQLGKSPGVTYLPATWRDFRRIFNLERLCFPGDSWPWVDVLAALTFPQTVRIKAETAGQIVGFVFGDRRRMRGLGWIASIGVHPDFRRRGIARMLLEACEVGLATPKLRLVLKPSNTAAKTLYMKAGYEEIDIWRRYYANGEDGLVMEKNSNWHRRPG